MRAFPPLSVAVYGRKQALRFWERACSQQEHALVWAELDFFDVVFSLFHFTSFCRFLVFSFYFFFFHFSSACGDGQTSLMS
jgi:hypothetical protein